MNEKSQRIAIADACGWTSEIIKSGGEIMFVLWNPPSGKLSFYYPPDYLKDLDAMHVAEKILNTDLLKAKYESELMAVICKGYGRCTDDNFWMIHATAAQRAEAFLKTLDLWKK